MIEENSKVTNDFDLKTICRQLIAMREVLGSDTPKGHAISNALELLETIKDYTRPAWATHETQTPHWELKQQLVVLSS
jgi:hypothetical protein